MVSLSYHEMAVGVCEQAPCCNRSGPAEERRRGQSPAGARNWSLVEVGVAIDALLDLAEEHERERDESELEIEDRVRYGFGRVRDQEADARDGIQPEAEPQEGHETLGLHERDAGGAA